MAFDEKSQNKGAELFLGIMFLAGGVISILIPAFALHVRSGIYSIVMGITFVMLGTSFVMRGTSLLGRLMDEYWGLVIRSNGKKVFFGIFLLIDGIAFILAPAIIWQDSSPTFILVTNVLGIGFVIQGTSLLLSATKEYQEKRREMKSHQ